MIDNLIKKIQSLFLFEDGQGVRKEQRLLLSSWLAKFFRNHLDQVNEIPEKTPIQSISNIILKWYSTDEEWPNKKIFIDLIEELEKIANNPSCVDLSAKLSHFVNNAPFEFLEKIGRLRLKKLASKFPREFINSSIRDLKILNLGIAGLAKDQLLNLATSLLSKSDSLNSNEEKQPYFDKLLEIKCCNDTNLINQFHSKLLAMKSTNPEFVKKNYSRRKIFSLAQRKELS